MKSADEALDLLYLNMYRHSVSYWKSLALERLGLREKYLASQWTHQTKATGAHYYHASNNKPWRIPSMVLLNGKVINDCQACLTGRNGFVQIIMRDSKGSVLVTTDDVVTKTLHGHVALVPGYYRRKCELVVTV